MCNLPCSFSALINCCCGRCLLAVCFHTTRCLYGCKKVSPSLIVVQSCVPLIWSFSVVHSASGIIINYSILQKFNPNSLCQTHVYINTFSKQNFRTSPLIFNVSVKSVIHYFLDDIQFVPFLVCNYLACNWSIFRRTCEIRNPPSLSSCNLQADLGN